MCIPACGCTTWPPPLSLAQAQGGSQNSRVPSQAPLAKSANSAKLADWRRAAGQRAAQMKGRSAMAESVYKVVEIVGSSSESWEKAARTAVETASKSLRDLRI